MQDIESHTIIYLRELLATRAVDEPDVAMACWLYEDSRASWTPPPPRRNRPHRGQEPLMLKRLAPGVAFLSRLWPDFCALHMTWGAINELTTLMGYRRLARLSSSPVVSALLERIALDESPGRFFFLYRQAEERLRRPGAAPSPA